jgi:predicted nucleotidyltransferase
MDLSKFQELAFLVRHELLKKNIQVDCIVLFGSQARNTARPDSDIDMAVISSSFGKDRHQEQILLGVISSKVNPALELLPLSLEQYLEIDTISPIVHEIQKDGVCLL